MADAEPKTRYTSEIQAMMYTFGDVRAPLPASAQLVEQLVRKQLIIQAAHVAQDIRNARSLSAEDVIFVIRRDPVKVSRLKEFLSWKDLRKNARPGEDSGLNVGMTGGVDTPEDELLGLAHTEGLGGTGESSQTQSTRPKPVRRKQAKLPWDLIASLVVEATGGEIDILEDEPVNPDVSRDMIRRLRSADSLTRDMSREEYMEYSECRQASFTYKKAKKFRDWLNPAQYIDFRLNDDVIEILGFLAWEMVRRLTEGALEVKSRWGTEGVDITEDEGCCTLFSSPSEKTAITPEHLHAAVIQINNENMIPYRCPCPAPNYFRPVRLF